MELMIDNLFVGIDEVGRGPLAGPLVAAAVILNKPINGLRDSKKLSQIKREEFDKIICSEALDFSIGWTDIDEINEKGLTYAVSNAMRIALLNLTEKYNSIIIDGNYNYLQDIKNVKTIVRADDIYPTVSAASILAKVYRDKWMIKLSEEYSHYGFEHNYGYGTKHHLAMLDMYGPCKIHRMFYKPLLKFTT
jgi:ribonuclease HII